MNEHVNAPANTVIEYDDGRIAIDLSKIPHSSAMALARYGLSHYLGNQQASKVSAAKAKALEATKSADGTIVPGRELSAEEVAKLKADFQAVALAAIHEGTMGQGVRGGPAKDPFETALDQLARESVKETLRKYGLKVPKADGVVTFADGTTRTMEEMVANRLAKEGETLRRAATKKVNDDKKKAEALRVAAAANSGKAISVEDLGL